MSRNNILQAALVGAAISIASTTTASTALAQDGPAPVGIFGGAGVELGGFADHSEGLMAGVGVHVGTRVLGGEIFGLMQGFVGGLLSGPHTGSAQGLLWSSAMFGLGVGPLHIAFGPSLDIAWGCDQQDERCFRGAPLLGFDVRGAVHFGTSFVSLDLHPTFYEEGTVTAIVAGVGWQL